MAKSVDPGEMARYKLSHLDIHCLQRMFWTTGPKGLILKASNKIYSIQHFRFLYFCYFPEKISLDISCDLSAWQMIHMKCQDFFSLKNNKNYCLLQS